MARCFLIRLGDQAAGGAARQLLALFDDGGWGFVGGAGELSASWLEQLPLALEQAVSAPLPETVAAVEAQWPHILQQLAGAQPAVGSWLRQAVRRYPEPGELDLVVGHKMGLDLLNARQVPQRLAQQLEPSCGEMTVRISHDPALDAPDPAAIGPSQARIEAALSEVRVAKPGSEEAVFLAGPQGRQQRRLAQVDGEENGVIVSGEVLLVEHRPLRSGRVMVRVDVTDRSDSLTAKAFVDASQAQVLERLQAGDQVRASGDVRHDRYSGELTLQLKRLARLVPSGRQDTAPREQRRVELHLHTKMSAMDAVVELEGAIAQAAAWDHPAIAVTDHGVVHAYPQAYECGQRYGITIIYGVEGYLVDDRQRPLYGPQGDHEPGEGVSGSPLAWLQKQRPYHVILLAATEQGLRNLYRLVSHAHLKTFYRVPRMPLSLIQSWRQGLIVGAACENGLLFRALLDGCDDEEIRARASFFDYLEIQPRANNGFLLRNGTLESLEELEALNRRIVALGRELELPVVATGDVHFLHPEDEILREILQAGQGFSDTRQAPLYLRPTQEMLAEFSYLGEETARQVVVEGPRTVAGQIETLTPVPEELHAPRVPGAGEQMRRQTLKAARDRYGEPLPAPIAQRIERELEAIIDNGYASIFRISQQLVQKSRADGYLVGSRGSVGSSLVATLLGITEVNPLPPHNVCPHCQWSRFVTEGEAESGFDLPPAQCPHCGKAVERDGHDIPFSVFMGFEGNKVPDIDLNFSGDYLNRIHAYAEDLLGRGQVFRAGTISTIADRTAYGFVRGFAQDRERVLRDAELQRLVKGLTGVKRTTGQHPGGLMIVPRGRDILDFTPVQHAADDKESGAVITHFDYHAIHDIMVKLDLLGHDDPTALRLLGDITGVDVTAIAFDDPETLAIFSGVETLGLDPQTAPDAVGTVGIPEFGTRFVRQMVADTLPTTFAELVRISGLSHGTNVWLNNARELVRQGTASLKEVICTRDDIMTFLRSRGMERAEAFALMEKVRNGGGLSQEEAARVEAVGVPDWYVDSCRKISYMFPKAHAIAYVMMAFRIAYFKVHHPAAFYATYFTVRANDVEAATVLAGPDAIEARIQELEGLGRQASGKDRNLLTVLEVAREMYLRGLTFLAVDLERSRPLTFTIEGEALRMPFAALPGVGEKVARNIVQARRAGAFLSVEDLARRARLMQPVVERLREQGCLEGLPDTNQTALF